MVEDIEVEVINVIAGKDIGDKFQDRGLCRATLSNKQDGVWHIRPVFRCFDDPLLERLDVTRKYRYNWCIGDVAVNLLNSCDVTLVVGVGNVFTIFIARRYVQNIIDVSKHPCNLLGGQGLDIMRRG